MENLKSKLFFPICDFACDFEEEIEIEPGLHIRKLKESDLIFDPAGLANTLKNITKYCKYGLFCFFDPYFSSQNNMRDAEQKLLRLINSMRILKYTHGNINYKFELEGAQNNLKSFSHYELDMGGEDYFYRFEKRDVEYIKRIYESISKLFGKSKNFKRIINAIKFFHSAFMINTNFPEIRFIQFVTALECLFIIGNDNISDRLSKRLSLFEKAANFATPKEPQFIKEVYQMRCDIVHGGGLKYYSEKPDVFYEYAKEVIAKVLKIILLSDELIETFSKSKEKLAKYFVRLETLQKKGGYKF